MNFIKTAIFILFTVSIFAWCAEEETLWESCDDLTKLAPSYGQKAWSPNAFKGTEIGRMDVCTEEKIEGKGSIRWVVTKQDVDDKLKEDPKFSQAMINFLYGQNFEPYIEVRFHIKCENPKHPSVGAMLLGGKPASIPILARDEVTKGWKEIKWNLKGVDIGRSEKWGYIMNYFRIFTSAGSFLEGDALDFHIDNMRLVTNEPEDVTSSSNE
ncbi:MAG: hypothetical protein JW957_08935 [Candidatus Omnitrophica bacterium]|nr:hypothetical protein [Candidatus Omnitrophota bacterium]